MANKGKSDLTNSLPSINLFKITLVRVTASKNREWGFYEKLLRMCEITKGLVFHLSSFVPSHQMETQQARGPPLLLIKAPRGGSVSGGIIPAKQKFHLCLQQQKADLGSVCCVCSQLALKMAGAPAFQTPSKQVHSNADSLVQTTQSTGNRC